MLLTHRINLAQISVFTNFVYVCQTSNHRGTISLFTLGKPRKRTRKQTRSSMILGFYNISFFYLRPQRKLTMRFSEKMLFNFLFMWFKSLMRIFTQTFMYKTTVIRFAFCNHHNVKINLIRKYGYWKCVKYSRGFIRILIFIDGNETCINSWLV